MREYTEKKETCGTICLKYLLFIFNFFFWVRSFSLFQRRCGFGGKSAESLALKSLAKSSDIGGTHTSFGGMKSHPLDLPAQAAEVVV